jgi:transaldolase
VPPAIEEAIFSGIPINVTLLFSVHPGCHLGRRLLRSVGVELGKVLAQRIIPELESQTELAPQHESSTNPMIRRYRKLRKTT